MGMESIEHVVVVMFENRSFDNLSGLLRELPSLPSRQAILLGWAVPVPVLVEITELSEEHRPKSSDPKFWEVWTGKEARTIKWQEIVQDWTGASSSPPDVQGGSTTQGA